MKKNLPFKPKAFSVLFLISVVLTFNKTIAQESLYTANVKFQSQPNRAQNPTTVTLKDAFQQLQKQLSISLIYNPSDVADMVVPNSELESAIALKSVDRLLKETQLAAHKISDNVYVIKSKNAKPNINVPKTGFVTPETQGTTPTTGPSVFLQDLPRVQTTTTLSSRDFQKPQSKLVVDRTIVGQVKDSESNETLPGVSIIVKGNSKIGTVTDDKGKFSLVIPDDAQALMLSYVGYENMEVTIGNQKLFDIKISADVKTLKEVVVVGYGEQKREDLTGAITSIKTSELKNLPQVSVDQLMQGKASGVVVTNNSGQPGSSASVRIRGITSLNGSNEPLYVIDGIPVSGDGQNLSSNGKGATDGFSWAGGGNGQTSLSPLSALNPSDILSIDILKDASATAIYGSRASNGVVIITTKRGKANDGKITYDAYYGIQTPSRYLDILPLNEFAKYQNDVSRAYGGNVRDDFRDPSLLGIGTDWQRELMKPAGMMSHQLGVSGGKDKMQYYVSGGYLNQDGIIAGSGFNRYSVRLNLDNQVKDWFRIGTNFTASRTKERITLTDDGDGVVTNALLQSPDVPVRNIDGTFGGPIIDNGATVGINPVAKALLIDNTVIRNRVMGNLYADLILLKDLTFRTELGTDLSFGRNDQFRPTYQWGRTSNPTAAALKSSNNSQFWILKNYLTYKHGFGKHNITAMTGHEVQESRWWGTSATRVNFITNEVKELSVGDKNGQTGDSYAGSAALESYFGRLVYSFDSKYSVTGTVRADGSSKFGPGRKWGTFSSVAAAYTISNEKFMKSISFISNLKIRLGYGQVGNQDIPNYQYNPTLSTAITGLGTGYKVNYTANPLLKWESANQSNLGLDMSFLKGRLDVSIDVYRKVSKDFLYPLPLPSFLGSNPEVPGSIGAPYVNLGEMQNEGIDFSFNSRNLVGNFVWSTGLNISTYKNTVNDIQGLSAEGKVLFNTLTITKTVAGQPIGQFYGYKALGIFRDPVELAKSPRQFSGKIGEKGNALGDIKFEDVNNDGKVDEKDLTYIGSPHPDFTFGVTNTFSYKNFDLSVFIQGSQGINIFNYVRRNTEGMDKLYTNQLKTVLDRWSPENPNSESNMPRLVPGSDNPNLSISSRFLEDGSYVRIQNLSIGYTLPTSALSRFTVSRLRIYATIQNLKTFTNYSGYDPEIGAYNQKALLMNIDNGRYPQPRTYTFGLNLEF
jgi:TonB-linked SusC/RagA family outer membrane protein